MRLAPEAKLSADSIKHTAYRAETAILGLLGRHSNRTEEEGTICCRMRRRACCGATCIPWGTPGATGHWCLGARRQALATETCLPMTVLRLVYESPVIQA